MASVAWEFLAWIYRNSITLRWETAWNSYRKVKLCINNLCNTFYQGYKTLVTHQSVSIFVYLDLITYYMKLHAYFWCVFISNNPWSNLMYLLITWKDTWTTMLLWKSTKSTSCYFLFVGNGCICCIVLSGIISMQFEVYTFCRLNPPKE